MWRLIACMLLFSVECGGDQFIFDPQSIWKGNLISTELRGDLKLCANDNWDYSAALRLCRGFGFQDGVMLYGSDNDHSEQESATCTFADKSGIFCRRNNKLCEAIAWLSCQFPGHRGCYAFQFSRFPGYEKISTSNQMDIQTCLDECRGIGRTYAGVTRGQDCYCSDRLPWSSTSIETYCNMPCGGESMQACGSQSYINIYETFLGSCEATKMSSSGYIASPGFPNAYPSDTLCTWSFQDNTFFNQTTITLIASELNIENLNQLLYLELPTIRPGVNEFYSYKYDVDLEFSGGKVGGILRNLRTTLNASENLLHQNLTVVFDGTSGSSENGRFLLHFQTNIVLYEIPIPTTEAPLTTSKCAVNQSTAFFVFLFLFFNNVL